MINPSNADILLTIPDVILQTSFSTEKGSLSLESITGTSPDPEDTKSPYMILHINAHKLLIKRASSISLVISPAGDRTYTFQPSNDSNSFKDKKPASEAHIIIPAPTEHTIHLIDVIETFDHILTQYANLSWQAAGSHSPSSSEPPLPSYESATARSIEGKQVSNSDLRGRLVLMDEESGQVVGEPPQRLTLKEDPLLEQEKHKKAGEDAGPVLLELPPDVYDAYTGKSDGKASVDQVEGEELAEAKEIFVRAIPPEDQSWMTTSATLISQAISTSTSLLLSGLTSASTYYISHSAPYTPPPSTPSRTSTPTSHPVLQQAHAWSGTAARASARTTEAVGGLIKRAVGGESSKTTPTSLSPAASGSSTPLSTSYKVYSPKARAFTSPPPPLPPRSNGSPAPNHTPNQNQAPNPIGTKERLLLSANLVLATVDDSARRMFEVGSERLGAVVGHKYGPDAQQSTHLATHTTKNVVLVYIDMQGFARRALIKKAGTEWVKAKLGTKKEQPVEEGPTK